MPARARRSPFTEHQLLVRYHRRGDQVARQEMIERGMALVHHVASRYSGRGISDEELVQVGAIGLIKAVDRFDLDRGVTFSTFAVPNILGEIRRHFRDHGWGMRVARSVQENSAKIAEHRDKLTAKLQRQPTLTEIAQACELTLDQVLDAMQGARQYTLDSLDVPLATDSTDEGNATRGDMLGQIDDGYEQTITRLTIHEGLKALQSREREVLRLRFEEGLLQREIAEKLGISQMHVSRLLAQALNDVRERIADPAIEPAALSEAG